MREEKTLPEGWVNTTLGAICSHPQYGYTTKAAPSGNVKFLRITDISSGSVNWETVPYCLKNPDYIDKYELKKDDILVSRTGASVGRSFRIEEPPQSSVFASYLIRFNTVFVEAKWAEYYLQSQVYWDFISDRASGSAQPNVNAQKLSLIPIPLPPLSEQTRIVAKLDAAFAKLREVELALEEVPRLLEEQKQSILFHAMSGQLSKEWRSENQNTENVVVFLKKLKKERKKSYDKAVKYAKENDLKKPKKDYEFEFQAHQKIKNWASATLDQLIYISARIGWKGLKAEEYTQEGPLFLSVHSLNYGEEVRFDKAYHISQERYEESPEIMLEEDDVLLCKDGAGIGKIGIVKNLEGDATVNSSLLVVRSLEAFIPKFLFYFLSGPTLQKIVQSRITGSAIPHLFQRDIKQFVLSVPPLEEQEFIVEKIEELFDVVNDLELVYKNSIKQVKRIKKTLLNQAFQGNLVPQNPIDEPAALLLEKIKVEKARMEEEMKAKRKARRALPKKKRIMKNLEIIEVLKIHGQPMKAHEVWKESKFRNDIDEFYAELRRVVEDTRNVEQEVRNDKETYLSLVVQS